MKTLHFENSFIICININQFLYLKKYNFFKTTSHQDFFAERFFNIFDVDKSRTVSLSELIGGFEMLGDDGTEADKLRFLFKVYDIDGKCLEQGDGGGGGLGAAGTQLVVL